MDWDPQVWAEVGVIGIAFGWLLLWTTSRLQAALDRNAETIEQLSRQVQINTLLVARMSGQDAADLEKLLANSGRWAPVTPHEVIRTYIPHARRYQEVHGLPGCVALAQAALETGWGKRIPGVNLFGIKALPGEPAQEVVTHEYMAGRRVVVTDRFRAFATPDEAFDALARVLMSPRYAPVREVCHDPDAFCEALQQCGYATDPAYARKLRAIISRWRRTELVLPPGPAEKG